MAVRRKGRGRPLRMPSDDASLIPIYSLSLVLLKSPAYSANREGTWSGEGKRGEAWGLEAGGSAEVVLAAVWGPEPWS